MVKRKESVLYTNTPDFSIAAWLEKLVGLYTVEQTHLINLAYERLQSASAKVTDESAIYLLSSLDIADILVELNLDYQTITAAILYEPLIQSKISLREIEQDFPPAISNLLKGVLHLNTIRDLQNKTTKNHSQNQSDNLRKMLVAMVDDVRVVLIKLAERLRTLQIACQFEETICQNIAREVNDIYAPLANRLGVWQLKWELEDLAFRYLQPSTYKEIAKSINNRRVERDRLIEEAMAKLTEALTAANLKNFAISGRAKHIYSIYKKMQRKDVNYQEIYDANAIRVLVSELDECYLVLSIAHNLWEQIPKEFDDYITKPKSNGYRSIHTAVIGPGNNNLEIQIRTYRMHEESELGVAAHWAYKEGKTQKPQQLDKIAWLRQVLDWQKELIDAEPQQTIEAFDKHVYVFSPAGDILDLPKGATPLDFAYAIHSHVGHRCRGAKVNSAIVPLTYQLKTGDQVEILTAKQPSPSRDWYNPSAGYLVSSKARAKVQQWFKQLDYDKHVTHGHDLLNKELQRLGTHDLNFDELAHKLHYAGSKDMYAALGSGSLKISQVVGAINQLKINAQPPTHEMGLTIVKSAPAKQSLTIKSAVNIAGISDLLTHLAGCCKPVPGDTIAGYITHAHSISIHRKNCASISKEQVDTQRLIDVDWNTLVEHLYPIDLQISVSDRHGLLRDVTAVLTAEKINIASLTTSTLQADLTALINLVIEVKHTRQLEQLIQKIKQLPGVFDVKRVK